MYEFPLERRVFPARFSAISHLRGREECSLTSAHAVHDLIEGNSFAREAYEEEDEEEDRRVLRTYSRAGPLERRGR